MGERFLMTDDLYHSRKCCNSPLNAARAGDAEMSVTGLCGLFRGENKIPARAAALSTCGHGRRPTERVAAVRPGVCLDQAKCARVFSG